MAIHAHHAEARFPSRGDGRVPRQGRPMNVPDTPEARAHAAEAEEFKRELRELAKLFEDKVETRIGFEQISPSADNRGHVRMNFNQLAALLDVIEELRDEVDALRARPEAEGDSQ